MSDLIARLERAQDENWRDAGLSSLLDEAAAALRQKEEQIADVRETCRKYVAMYEAEMERSTARARELAELRAQQPKAE